MSTTAARARRGSKGLRCQRRGHRCLCNSFLLSWQTNVTNRAPDTHLGLVSLLRSAPQRPELAPLLLPSALLAPPAPRSRSTELSQLCTHFLLLPRLSGSSRPFPASPTFLSSLRAPNAFPSSPMPCPGLSRRILPPQHQQLPRPPAPTAGPQIPAIPPPFLSQGKQEPLEAPRLTLG